MSSWSRQEPAAEGCAQARHDLHAPADQDQTDWQTTRTPAPSGGHGIRRLVIYPVCARSQSRAAAAESRTEMCPSSEVNRSSAEGQRRASHSLCELGTTRSRPPCRKTAGATVWAGSPNQDHSSESAARSAGVIRGRTGRPTPRTLPSRHVPRRRHAGTLRRSQPCLRTSTHRHRPRGRAPRWR